MLAHTQLNANMALGHMEKENKQTDGTSFSKQGMQRQTEHVPQKCALNLSIYMFM